MEMYMKLDAERKITRALDAKIEHLKKKSRSVSDSVC